MTALLTRIEVEKGLDFGGYLKNLDLVSVSESLSISVLTLVPGSRTLA